MKRLAPLVVGCTTISKRWFKPGATAKDFEDDEYTRAVHADMIKRGRRLIVFGVCFLLFLGLRLFVLGFLLGLPPRSGWIFNFLAGAFSARMAWWAAPEILGMTSSGEIRRSKLTELIVFGVCFLYFFGLPPRPNGGLNFLLGAFSAWLAYWAAPDEPVVQPRKVQEEPLAVVTEGDILREVHARRCPRYPELAQAVTDPGELTIDDFVIHAIAGVGRYRGLKHLKVGETEGDFLHLEYAGGDRLYVPVDRISLVQKYVGSDDPALDALGLHWENVDAEAVGTCVTRAVETLRRLGVSGKVVVTVKAQSTTSDRHTVSFP